MFHKINVKFVFVIGKYACYLYLNKMIEIIYV
jgi:hypothetical protein